MATDDPYQSLQRIKARVDYEPDDFFGDNAEKRFDRLLYGTEEVGDGANWLGLEAEARAIIETMTGDETWNREVDRVDEIRTTSDAAMPLVYPIQSITSVEGKQTQQDTYEALEDYWYDHTEHRLILERGRRRNVASQTRGGRPANELTAFTNRATWRDYYTTIRVTYTRGFDPIPYDIQQIQIDLINRMLRHLKTEQTIAAAAPEDFAGVNMEFDVVVTDAIRQRIEGLTPLAGATQSV